MRRGHSTMTHAGLPEPASNAPAQTKRDALGALWLCRWPPGGLACVPTGLRLCATAFRERLLQPGQLAVLEPQSETVREGRGIHGQILHPQVDQVVGCLEAAVPSDIDGSEPDCRRGEPVLGTWAVGEESIPIRHQRHLLNFRTFRTRPRIVPRSRLRVAASCRGRITSHCRAVDPLRRLGDGSRQRRGPSIRNRARPNRREGRFQEERTG
jgi:hypothetical protein